MQLMFSDCIVIVRNMLQSLKRFTFYFPTWNGERTQRERWARAERNLVSAYEQWMNTERK